MNNIEHRIRRSAQLFRDRVWPKIVNCPLIGSGQILPVEGVTQIGFAKTLDMLAGIDAWQVRQEDGCMRGIASRVQEWPLDREQQSRYPYHGGTWTIRVTSRLGNDSELQKRLYAITAEGEWLYPAITVQSFLDADLRPICIGVCMTVPLILAANGKYQQNEILKPRNGQGEKFVYVIFDKLKEVYPDGTWIWRSMPLAESGTYELVKE